jgi:hypothetical protein
MAAVAVDPGAYRIILGGGSGLLRWALKPRATIAAAIFFEPPRLGATVGDAVANTAHASSSSLSG